MDGSNVSGVGDVGEYLNVYQFFQDTFTEDACLRINLNVRFGWIVMEIPLLRLFVNWRIRHIVSYFPTSFSHLCTCVSIRLIDSGRFDSIFQRSYAISFEHFERWLNERPKNYEKICTPTETIQEVSRFKTNLQLWSGSPLRWCFCSSFIFFSMAKHKEIKAELRKEDRNAKVSFNLSISWLSVES